MQKKCKNINKKYPELDVTYDIINLNLKDKSITIFIMGSNGTL